MPKETVMGTRKKGNLRSTQKILDPEIKTRSNKKALNLDSRGGYISAALAQRV